MYIKKVYIEKNVYNRKAVRDVGQGLKARIFNIMQYEHHPETGELLLSREKIDEALKHKTVLRYAGVLHDKDTYSDEDELSDSRHIKGQVKPPHWHLCLQCTQAVEIGTIARWFGIAENFIDIPKGRGAGKFLDCVEYLTHESEKQQALGKHRYDDGEIFANFDWRTELDKRNESRLKYGDVYTLRDQMRYEVLYNGKTLKQCIADDPKAYMDDITKLKQLRLEYIAKQRPPRLRINFYVSGRGGAGKGLMCRAIARAMYPWLEDDDCFFEVGTKNALFEGYDGQPVLIWNDYRAWELIAALGERGNVYNVFDTHPSGGRQNVKYASVKLCNEVNLVNSIEPYNKFLDELAGEYTSKGVSYKSEDKSQSYRRFPMILEVREEDFDMMFNRGFIEQNDCYFEYIRHKRIVGNMRKIEEACRADEKLAHELETQMIKPLINMVAEIQDKAKEQPKDEAEIRQMFAGYGKELPIGLDNVQVDDLPFP